MNERKYECPLRHYMEFMISNISMQLFGDLREDLHIIVLGKEPLHASPIWRQNLCRYIHTELRLHPPYEQNEKIIYIDVPERVFFNKDIEQTFEDFQLNDYAVMSSTHELFPHILKNVKDEHIRVAVKRCGLHNVDAFLDLGRSQPDVVSDACKRFLWVVFMILVFSAMVSWGVVERT